MNKLTKKLGLTKDQNLYTGIALCVVGIVAALYVAIWLCFIGGAITIIEAIKADPVSGGGILWGIIRWSSSSIAFWITIIIIFGTGTSFLKAYDEMNKKEKLKMK